MREFDALSAELQQLLLDEGIPFGQLPETFRTPVVELIQYTMHTGYQSLADKNSIYVFDPNGPIRVSVAGLNGAKQVFVTASISLLVNFLITDPPANPAPAGEQSASEQTKPSPEGETPPEENESPEPKKTD